jgi:hypothetical protein
MTIDEMKAAKTKCEGKIREALYIFEDQTKCKVNDFKMVRSQEFGGCNDTVIDVKIKVEM